MPSMAWRKSAVFQRLTLLYHHIPNLPLTKFPCETLALRFFTFQCLV
jgi:hypothetical protein